MNDRDCESCKKFSRNDPHEWEGYCQAKRYWVDPQEGEVCKMHEFTLHSATKYKDGTPIMTEPEKAYCETDTKLIQGESNQLDSKPNQLDTNFCTFGMCAYYDKFCDHTLQDKHMCPHLPHDTDSNIKYLEQVFTEFAKTQDELIEEYDATLKTHGDTLEEHLKMITINEGNIDALSSDVEDLQQKVHAIYQFLNSVAPDFFFNLCEEIKKNAHKGSNFCGNCTHVKSKDGIYACDLTSEIVNPDDSSCSMFEPPF